MATKKPRITITLDQKNYDLLVRVAKAQDTTMSKFINEMVSELAPSLTNLLGLIQAAKNAPKEVLQEYSGLVDNELQRATDFISANQNQLDWVIDSMTSRSVQPPYINKGVRSKSDGGKSSKHKGSVVSGHFSGKGAK